MNIKMKSLALFGLIAVSPLVAAPPPPPAPPSEGTAESGRATTQTESPESSAPVKEQSTQGQPTEGQRASDGGEENVSLRGPLHEAFARPVSFDPVRQPVIKEQPPEQIEEIPPEYRPDGDNVIWIPGYWSYEDSDGEFLWISGTWRDVPPGRRWVPGYWSPAEGGYLWTPGEWISADQRSLSYLPEPPRSQERGPSSEPPDHDHFWVPGSWEYHDHDYAWRPGYWARHHQGWVWVPAHYDWTPNGYVYCTGYWDYDIDRRGIVYAPYRYPGYHVTRYTPRTALNVPRLLIHLFVNNRTGGYYFGDYYGRDTYRPWYAYHASRSGYDPIYSYNSWRHGDDYRIRLTGWNSYFNNREDFRPRRTLNAQRQFLNRNDNRDIAAQINIAQTVTGAVGSELFGNRVVNVNSSERDSVVRTANALQALAGQRLDVEARGRARGRGEASGRANDPGQVDADAKIEGRGAAQAAPLELPKVERIFPQSNRSREGKEGAVERVLPNLPGATEGRPGAGRNPGSNDNRGRGNDRGKGLLNNVVPKGATIPETNGRKSVAPEGKLNDQPKVDVKPEPKARPQVRPIPQAEPKAEPKPRPKAEPKPRPKADSGNRGGGNAGGKSGGKGPKKEKKKD